VLVNLVLLTSLIASSDSLASAPPGPRADSETVGIRSTFAREMEQDSVPRRRRPKAIEYSEWYERRATVHRIASWTTIPLFAAEVVTGQELFKNGPEAADWAKDSHGIIAASLGGLFALNTVTGVWNLWDARHDANGRKWRTLHAVLMLAADAGFAYTGSLADDAEESAAKRRQHRTAAITSSSIALVGYFIMLPPVRRD
jgi:uncharacterized membrane protein